MGMPTTLERPLYQNEPGRIWTADEVAAFPEVPGLRFEVVDGELFVSPGPSWDHQRAVFWLMRALNPYVEHAPRAGEVMFGPGDARLDALTLVQPDVFVAPLIAGKRPNGPHDVQRFLLVIEVLSPGSRRADRIVKRQKYQKTADEYWLVDPSKRRVERWLAGRDEPEMLVATASWQAPGRAAPLMFDLPALFRETFAEAP
jgi:Uma2 family endonuclease